MIKCRHCGAELGYRATFVKRGDVLQLWYGQWTQDPDGVWRKKKRIRKAGLDSRGGGERPVREGFDWMMDPDHGGEAYWRIWAEAIIECPRCGESELHRP